ncbi:MAG: hypothetical protein AB7T49_10740 [Oligoflexales bacterium]
MKKINLSNVRLLTAALVLPFLSSCFNSIFDSAGKVSGTAAVKSVAPTQIEDGRVTAEIDFESTATQTIEAGSDVDLAGTSVSFPPGALSVSTGITIEKSASLEDTVLNELDLTGNSVEVAGSGVIIRPTESKAAAMQPFTIQLPVPSASLRLQGSALENLAILYHVWDTEGSKLVGGILPFSSLRIENGVVAFDTRFFGAYQVIIMAIQIAEKVEKPVEEPIRNASNVTVVSTAGVVEQEVIVKAEALPNIEIAAPTLTYTTGSRKVSVAAKQTSKFALKDCKVELRKSKDVYYGLVADTGANLSSEFVISDLSAISVVGQVRCSDENGRLGESPWSAAVKVPAITLTMNYSTTNKTMTLTANEQFSINATFGCRAYLSKNANMTGAQVSGVLTNLGLSLPTNNTSPTYYYGRLSCIDPLGVITYSQVSAPVLSYGYLPTLTLNPFSINLTNAYNVTLSGNCSEDTRPVQIGGPVTYVTTCNAGAWTTMLSFTNIPDGPLAITIDHSSAQGAQAIQVMRNIIKDTVVPNITVNSSAYINNVNKNAYPLSGTCSDSGRLVIITGAASGSAMCVNGTWSTNVNYGSQPEGSVGVTVSHTDVAGNTSQGSTTLTKETIPPVLAITSSAIINSSTASGYILNGSCTDTGTVTIGGAVSTTAPCTASMWSTTVNYSSRPDGAIAVTASMADIAGNIGTASRSLTKDTAPPTVTVNAGPMINLMNAASFSVTGTCSENGATVNLGGPITDTTTCAAHAWGIVMNYTSVGEVTFSVTADTTDAAGNNATQASQTFTKDSAPPSVTIAGGPIISLANVSSYTITGTCSEEGRLITLSGAANGTSTCSAGLWSKMINASTMIQGANSVYADHTDLAGNLALQASNMFNKDTIPPTVSITSGSPINVTNVTNYPLSGTCSEDGQPVTIGGAINTSVPCSAGAWFIPMDYTSQGEGSVSVTADIFDTSGNPASQASVSLTKNTALPTVSFMGAAPINMSNQYSYMFSGACSEDGRMVLIDGPGPVDGSANCSGGSWTTNIDLSSLGDNPSITFFADHSNAVGNYAIQANTTLMKDIVPPMANIFGSPAGTNPVNSLSISIGGSEVYFYKYKIDDGSIDCTSPTDYSAERSTAIQIMDDISFLPGGPVKLCVIGRDNAGNYQNLGAASFAMWTRPYNHRIFITSGTFNGNLGGSASANSICQSQASNAALPGDWRALLSMPGRNARDIPILGEVRNMLGQLVATDQGDLWDGNIQNSIGYDQFGAGISKQALTGSTPSGTYAAGQTCGDYTNMSGNGQAGSSTMTNNGWISNGAPACSTTTFGLYCLERFGADSPQIKAASGPSMGDVSITVTTPNDLSYFARFEVRRDYSTYPPPDCFSGSVVYSQPSVSPNSDYPFTDSGGVGEWRSYRVCVYNGANELKSDTAVFRGARSKGGTQDYHRIFVTSAAVAGSQGGLAGMDIVCQNVAGAVSLPGSWMAIASTASMDARNRMSIYLPVLNMRDETVAVDSTDLWDGSLASPVKYDESGNMKSGPVWTGTDGMGMRMANTCSDWSSGAGNGAMGQIGTLDHTWLGDAPSGSCSTSYPIYCISQ